MATNITKKPISPDDFQMETGGSGAVGNFTRATSSGGTESVPKFSAGAIPVIDAPIVTSARRPFALISPASDTDVEECIRQVRINANERKNFEHYGGTPGSIDDATAKRNVAVFKKIVDDINAEGRNNGIFFPGTSYEFLEDATLGGQFANYVLPIEISSLVMVGTPATQLVARAGSAKTFVGLYGGSDIFMLDLKLVAAANNKTVSVVPTTAVMSGLHFDRVTFSGSGTIANQGLHIADTTNHVKDLWINDCTLSSVAGIVAYNTSGIRAKSCLVSGTGGGVQLFSTKTTAGSFGNIVFQSFNLLAGNLDVTVQSATKNSAIHGNVRLLDNTVSAGDIFLDDCNEADIIGNTLYGGKILAQYDGTWSAVYGIRIESNRVNNEDASQAIQLTSACTNTRRWWIDGNDIYFPYKEGILVSGAGGGTLIGGSVCNNMILDPNQEGSGTNDGIWINAGGGAVRESLIAFNRIRSTATGKRPNYGINEDSASNVNNTFVTNIIQGWLTGAINGAGTGHQAYNTRDLGGAV